MNKIIFTIALSLVLFIMLGFLPTVVSLENTSAFNECKVNCSEQVKIDLRQCRQEHKSCLNDCKESYDICVNEQEEVLTQCQSQCTTKKCMTSCLSDFRANKRLLCNYSSCRKSCSIERRECISQALDTYKQCRRNCQYTPFDPNITCENGKYSAGEKFLEGCEECVCEYNGKVKCKKTQFCNYPLPNLTEEQCEASGGLYHQLCRGPFFGIGCSQDSYCLCDGNNNYTCPEDNSCVKDFISPKIKRATVPGWRDLIGTLLGDIGICAPTPNLPNCGNGICENILTDSNSTAETSVNCPQDCV